MKKLILFIAILPLFAHAQIPAANDTTLYSGSTAFTPQFRFKAVTLNGVSYRIPQVYNSLLGKYDTYATTKYLNAFYAPATGSTAYWKINQSNTSTGTQNITDGFTSGVSIGSNGGSGVIWGYDVPSKFLSTANIALNNGYTNINAQGNSGMVNLSVDFDPKVIVNKDTVSIINPLRLNSVATDASPTKILTRSGGEIKEIDYSSISSGFIQNKYGSTSPQANSKIIVSDTVRSNTALIAPNSLAKNSLTVGVDYPATTQSIIFHGDSYVAGSDATTAANRFTNQIATALNLTLVNNGINSTAWADFLNSTYFNSLPNYNASVFAIVLKYGTNDAGGSVTTTQHSANVGAAIDSLHNIKGYPLNKIILIGTPYNYLNPNQTKLEEFARRDSLMAAQKGVKFVEMYHYQKTHGGDALYNSPGLHWNNKGHKSAFTHFIEALGYTNLIGDAFINNNLTVKNKATIGYADITTANITGFELHNGKIDTATVTKASINYGSIANPLDSLNFKLTGNVTAGRNTVLVYDNGSNSKAGIGPKAAALQVFGGGGMNFGAGAGINASTLNTTNAAFYIDALGVLRFNATAFMNNLTYSGTVTSTSGDNTRVFRNASANTGYLYAELQNSGGLLRMGIDNSSGAGLASGGDAYAAMFGNTLNAPVNFFTNSSVRYAISASGNHDFKSGTAKFGSLTASQLVATDASKNLISTTALPSGTTVDTQSPGDNSTKVATTAFVANAVGAFFRSGNTSLANQPLNAKADYFFNGTTATWTLPVPNSSNYGLLYSITIKNRGSGNLTINSNSGGNDIYTTSAVNTETIAPGAAVMYVSDGVYWNHE